MIFDGIRFRINHNIVMMPQISGEPNVRFGRVVKPGNPTPPKAEATKATWPDGAAVIAVPIPVTGHSLTNMAYGADGRIYLGKDGYCYTAKARLSPVQSVVRLSEALKEERIENNRLRTEIGQLRKDMAATV